MTAQVAENGRHNMQLDLAPTPPINADEQRQRQVILNLLSNAVKFSPEHGKIKLALRREDSEVIFSIQDNGLGILPEELEHLFERFQRGDAAERLRIRGTGLGLALCRDHSGASRAHLGRERRPEPGRDVQLCPTVRPERRVGGIMS